MNEREPVPVPEVSPTRETKADRHGAFVASLSERLIWRYTDGGPGRTRDKRKAKAAKSARRRNRV